MNGDEARVIARRMVPENTAPITLSGLESYLAEAVNLLRGSIGQADFKAYIFPLKYFKRISDVYMKEYCEALANSGDGHEFASFRENHRFAIPDDCLWEDVRGRTENIGQALQTAFREIEKVNPDTLYGIFGNASWTNKDSCPIANSPRLSSTSQPPKRSPTQRRRRTCSATPRSSSLQHAHLGHA